MDKEFREGIPPLCPVCGRELDLSKLKGGGTGESGTGESGQSGWNCKCGEFIPERLAINPFEGCTHGRNCNCGREMKR